MKAFWAIMKKDFIHLTTAVLSSWFGLILILMVSCSGGGDVDASKITVVAQHQAESIPTFVDHVHYAAIDGGGNRTYLNTEFPMSASHILGGIPINTTLILASFHADNEEEFNEVVQPITPLVSYQYNDYIPMEFTPKRLAIVDMDNNTGNILVRGNLPWRLNSNAKDKRKDRHFAYDDINTAMQKRIDQLGINFTFNIEEYELIEFVLHGGSGTGNLDDLTLEMNVLGRPLEDIPCAAPLYPYECKTATWDPKAIYTSMTAEKKPWGLVWWPQPACTNKPCDDTAGMTKKIALTEYQFINTSGYLKELLTTGAVSNKKRLIYFHCVTGSDRTGALHIAYMLDNDPTLTFEQAIARARKGIMQGKDEKDLKNKQLEEDLLPLCTYAGLAYVYCQEKNQDNLKRCDMPNGFQGGATLCK